MSVKRDALAFKVPGKVLGTRTLGRDVAAELLRRAGSGGHDLIVDFSGARVASSPFLDEVAKALRAWKLDHADRYLLLTGLNEDVADTLTLVLERLEMTLTQLKGGKLKLIGGREHLDITLEKAEQLEVFTASELAEQLQLKLPNLHQRLVALQAAGAVVRVRPEGAPVRPGKFAVPPAELAAAL
jgi:anti-anti-sigma regulatory factor